MLFGSQSAQALDIIRAGKGAHDTAGFLALKQEAQRWRADGYDAHVCVLRDLYEGRIAAHLQEHVKQRFPLSGSKMPMVPFNWAKLYAENGAAVYDRPPSRHLEVDGVKLGESTRPLSMAVGDRVSVRHGAEHSPQHRGKSATVKEVDGPMLAVLFDGDQQVHRWYSASEVDRQPASGPPPRHAMGAMGAATMGGGGDDAARVKDFLDMLRESQLDTVMAEAERRVLLAKTVFLRVRSDAMESKATGLPPRTCVDVFWPSDVLVIPHPRCPASLATAVCVMFRVSGDDGVQATGTTWEVWSRAFTEDADGELEKFGSWRAELVREYTAKDDYGKDGTKVDVKPLKWKATATSPATEEYPLKTLPCVAWHNGIAAGSPFLDADRNLVGIFHSINEAIGSELFAVDMNAATPLVRKSESTTTPSTIALGPGLMPTIPVTDSIEAVQLNADFAGIRGATRALQGNLALTSRQPQDGLDVDSSAPESGVARQIKNEPQSKARREAIARAVEVETRPKTGLLAVMSEVHDHFRATSIVSDGVVFVMTPQEERTYETPAEAMKIAVDGETAGLMTKAEARVRAGLSRTIEEAKAAMLEVQKERKENAPKFGGGGFGFGRSSFQKPEIAQPDDADLDARTDQEPPA